MSLIIVLSVLSCLYFMPVELLFASLIVILASGALIYGDRLRVSLFPGVEIYVCFLLSGTAIGLYRLLAVHDYVPKHILKDMVYVLFPFLFWLLGKNIVLQKGDCFTNLFIAGTALSSYDFANSIFRIIQKGFSGMSLYQFRHMIGAGHTLTLFTMFLYIYMPQNVKLKKKQAYGCVSILLLDLLIHFSRLNILNAIIFLAFLKKFRNPARVFQCGVLLAAGGMLTYGMFPSIFNNYTERLANTVTEMSHVRDTWDHVSIVTNWRGYEVYCELKKFRQVNLAEKILGGGFGAQLDVEGKAYLVTTEETLPFLHNGYFSILMIWGILGCAAFVLMLFILYFRNRTLAEEYRELWKAFVLIMAVDTLVVHGLFFSASVASIFLYLGVLERTRADKTPIQHESVLKG